MPAFVVEFAPAAVRDLKRLAPQVCLQLLRASRILERDSYPSSNPRVKLLAGMASRAYRLRAGDYRIIYRIEGGGVIVVRVAHRREVYR
ncbi:MAG: type II toxin-antitoxin system RelE/ParE family toxin [Candidatus Omnitrophica bacterium]|nr:type II toxin-antitoxin system RelE/ParE family toxin [Candidatus Omnitrophota bacterium]